MTNVLKYNWTILNCEQLQTKLFLKHRANCEDNFLNIKPTTTVQIFKLQQNAANDKLLETEELNKLLRLQDFKTTSSTSKLILPSKEYSDIEEDISETEDAPELSSDVHPPSSTDSSSDESSEGAFSSSTNSLMSKNGSMQWYLSPMKKGRLAKSNVIKLSPGPTRYAIAKITDIRSSFALFISSRMEKIILQMKNFEGLRLYKDAWKQTDETDFHAYIGLLILAGIYKSHGEATSSLWNTENGRPIFPSAMSAYITVDEQLTPFRCRCPFRQYMLKKPAKYGINVWILCDAKTSYAWNMQIYPGK
ncbi:hypothetical protein T07_10034 [Trichinella nelsoni]|uniref:PiggyBac transposable element-derived protein domain-containing protein n=1 Tax=Trichinella nelsoni TaxID=6336 RepID=A0A0V0SMY4_9BILA|nr:hypothetical protein T07_10034 [Trichinella nelsoni]